MFKKKKEKKRIHMKFINLHEQGIKML